MSAGKRSAMPMRGRALASLLLIALAHEGCSFHFGRKAPPKKPDAAAPLRLGRVALVNPDENFALIETFGLPAPNSGARLRVYQSDGTTVDLRATDVRRRPFLVADLVSGLPAKGDVVFQLHPEATASATPTPTATPAPTPTPARPSWWRRLLPFGVRK